MDDNLEELTCQESIVSAAGLNSEQVLIGIRGASSLLESATIRKHYDSKLDSLFNSLQPDLEDILLNRGSQHWLPPWGAGNIPKILSTVRESRKIEEYYLRNITICTVQGIVRMQLDYDGTQIIDAHNFKHLLEENIEALKILPAIV